MKKKKKIMQMKRPGRNSSQANIGVEESVTKTRSDCSLSVIRFPVGPSRSSLSLVSEDSH